MVLGFLKCIFMFNYVHMSVCVCMHVEASRRYWIPGHGVIGSVSFLTWVLGTKSASPGAAVERNYYSVSPALVWSFYLELGCVLWG